MDSAIAMDVLYYCSAAIQNIDNHVTVSTLIFSLFVLFGSYCISKICYTVYTFLTSVHEYRPDLSHLKIKEENKMYGRVRRKNGLTPEAAPPMVPNGWYYVICSDELRKEEVKHVSMCGLELAVFRDLNGDVHALDAFCPHLGANMGVGGKVRGNCLECPFHAWKFDGDGKCVDIPGVKRIPDVAKTKSWPVLERNLVIFLWYDAEDRDPLYLPREIDFVTEDGWVVHGRAEHTVYCHASEIPENGADIGHFNPVHRANAAYGSDLEKINRSSGQFMDHMWSNPTWQADKNDWYLATGQLYHDLVIRGHKVPLLGFKAKFEQIGPGVVYLETMQQYGSVILMILVVPMGTFKQKLIHVALSSNNLFGRMKSLIVIRTEGCMVERDMVIWNNKRFTKQSVFSSSHSDELIVKFRRWYSQFYSENSKAKSEELKADLSW